MQQRAVNKKLSHFFRLRGLQLRPDAMTPLHSLIENDPNWQDTLAALLHELDKLPRVLLTAHLATASAVHCCGCYMVPIATRVALFAIECRQCQCLLVPAPPSPARNLNARPNACTSIAPPRARQSTHAHMNANKAHAKRACTHLACGMPPCSLALPPINIRFSDL